VVGKQAIINQHYVNRYIYLGGVRECMRSLCVVSLDKLSVNRGLISAAYIVVTLRVE